MSSFYFRRRKGGPVQKLKHFVIGGGYGHHGKHGGFGHHHGHCKHMHNVFSGVAPLFFFPFDFLREAEANIDDWD
ncbi:MAG: hypothetical protein LBR56_04945 [Sporomusaceae bacterium]|nr:hypothetical protein [Sporomusaceae bacterium]